MATTRIYIDYILSTHETIENSCNLNKVSKPTRERKLQRKMTWDKEKLRPLPQNRPGSKNQNRNRNRIQTVKSYDLKIAEARVSN